MCRTRLEQSGAACRQQRWVLPAVGSHTAVLALLAFSINSSLERPPPVPTVTAKDFFPLQPETALGASQESKGTTEVKVYLLRQKAQSRCILLLVFGEDSPLLMTADFNISLQIQLAALGCLQA